MPRELSYSEASRGGGLAIETPLNNRPCRPSKRCATVMINCKRRRGMGMNVGWRMVTGNNLRSAKTC
jgi:hypothetical protein